MDTDFLRSGRWIWLGSLTSYSLFALSNGKLLLASGCLLLGVFAFFNNPLSATTKQAGRPSIPVALSWACGILGVFAVLAAAAGAVL